MKNTIRTACLSLIFAASLQLTAAENTFASGSESGGGSSGAEEQSGDTRSEKREALRKKLKEKREKKCSKDCSDGVECCSDKKDE